MKKKKFLSLVLVLAMVLTQMLAGIPAYGASEPDRFTFDISEGDITVAAGSSGLKVTYGLAGGSVKDNISTATNIIIIQSTSTPTTNKVVVNGVTANITVNGVNIQETADEACAFALTNSANVTLTLTGINILKSGTHAAGLGVAVGQSITIKGTGSLDVTGGEGGAGIGGGIFGNSRAGGTINIAGGTVKVTGGKSGAGIGGGASGASGTIEITGGVVTATGSNAGAGIGGGSYGEGGTINIKGGMVTAICGVRGTTSGAGIGGGCSKSGGTINITDGTVTATCISNGAGIGDGYGNTGAVGTITIDAAAIVKAVSLKSNSAIQPVSGGTAQVLMANFASQQTPNTNTSIYSEGNTKSYAEFAPTGYYESIAFTVPSGTYQLKTGGKLQQQSSQTPSTDFVITGAGITTFAGVTTVPTATVITDAASNRTSTGATLNGRVNAKNTSTTVTFEYGLTTGYGNSVTAGQSPISGVSNTAVSKALTALTPNTTYHYRVKGVNAGGTTTGSDQTFITSAVAPMTGTVTIAGNAKFGQTLTATPSLTNGGTITYQWNRNGVPISGAIGSNYTLKEEDIGKSITVTVTADGSVGTGSITSSGTGTIAKADGPSAPSIAPAMKSKTQTSVTLDVNTLYEYSKDNGATWQDSGVFTGLTASTEYTFVARVKATSTIKESGASAGIKITTDATPMPPTPKPEQTPIKGDVIDKNGESVKGIEAQVSTETNGNKTVEVKSKDAILVKQPDGTKAPLSDVSKLKLEVKDNTKVSIAADGTIQVKDLANGTETKISVTYDLGNGQKICMGTMEVKVDSNGNVSLTSTLVDPYGTITDAATGKVIEGADVKLYYANTDRNKAAGKTPDTLVQLPIIDGFKPNNNKNPQVSDTNGAYGFMVFPTSDYYIVATKDGYNEFKSPTISVEQDIVKLDFKMNKPSKGLDRLSGLNRVDTAIEIAKKSYTGKLSNVILATADGYSDALAGSVLAYKLNAPILLVGSSAADQEKVLAYIKANMDATGNVYILGGTGVITSAFEANVAASGFKNITRLGGANRYETSLKIANKLDTKVGTPVVLAYGEDYPDALSISSTAAVMQYPILLVQKDGMSDAVKQKLAEIKPTKVYIIGLQGVINASVEDRVAQTTSIAKGNIVRIGGQDRYETSLAVAKYFNLNGQNVCIATGNNYPDAVAGSVYAANSNSPIILADGNLSDNAINYLKTRKITGATIFGGEAVVSKEIEKKISELIVK